MAVLKTQAFPLADYPSGVNTFGPLNIRNQDVAFFLQVRRCTTPDQTIWPDPATTLQLELELSLDNGQTWSALGGFTSEGGIVPGLHEPEAQFTAYGTDLASGNQRRLRGTVTIVNGPLRTEGFLELHDTK